MMQTISIGDMSPFPTDINTMHFYPQTAYQIIQIWEGLGGN